MFDLTDISYYLPKENYSNQLLIKNNKSIIKIINKVGINKKYAAGEDEYSTDLAISAIKKILRKNSKLLNKIDYFIYCTQSPDYSLPSGSSFIQNKLFPNRHIPSIDINLGCSGFVYSLSLAQGLIASNQAKTILIATSDTYSKIISKNDLSVRSIFGDGAAAVVIQKSKNKQNYYFDQGTDGSGNKDLICYGSGLKDDDHEKNNNNLYMNGLNLFNFTLKAVPNSIKTVLRKNNLKLDQIDFFIFHQANKYMLESLRDKLKIDKKKFYINLENKGNTTSSSIPIAIYESIEKKLLKKNYKVLLCGFGVGYSWSTTIININKKFLSALK